jgi:hypothetical protein
MEKGISYLNRNFHDYRNSLLDFTKQYYPELEDEFNDASVGSWLLDVVSNIGDNLSYHIDRVYQETNIDSAQEKASVYALARNSGFKIPGPKASMAEVKFSCEIPVNGSKNNDSQIGSPNWDYAPCIKRGTKVSSGNQVFELLYDVDFYEQFNENGVSNRTIEPKRNSNGFIEKYVITKTGIVSSGETKIYKKTITSQDITPFMNFIIPDTNIMNVESIIIKDGVSHFTTPTLTEFYYDKESNLGKDDCGEEVTLWRFFEVDHLSQQYRWGDYIDGADSKKGYVGENGYVDENGSIKKEYYITKGAWIPLRQKFITEFTDSGYLRVTFGPGTGYYEGCPDTPEEATYEHLISHIVNNDGLGVLPNANTTMFILYRKGGGSESNVAQGAITSISFLNADIRGTNSTEKQNVKRSISVTNTSPSVSGRDMPTIDELKYLIKYNNGAQERCVTLKDYHDRISKLPPRYGCPFRYGVIEENNKIMIYTLGLDSNGNLTEVLPDILRENLQNYLSEYRMINDYIEIKSGRIVNLQFEVDLYVDKNYITSDVVTNVINKISDYMNINKLQMGDDIFVGDIEKEISKIDGVLNLIELRVFNIFENGYSNSKITQQIMLPEDCYPENEALDIVSESNRDRVNLVASDKMLYTENDTMFEIKYPKRDIICRVKTR